MSTSLKLLRAHPLPWEWCQINPSWGRYGQPPEIQGWIPRWVLEELGVSFRGWDSEPRNGIFFNKKQSEAMRKSVWWRTDEQFKAS